MNRQETAGLMTIHAGSMLSGLQNATLLLTKGHRQFLIGMSS
jgi:hypothetical protein